MLIFELNCYYSNHTLDYTREVNFLHSSFESCLSFCCAAYLSFPAHCASLYIEPRVICSSKCQLLDCILTACIPCCSKCRCSTVNYSGQQLGAYLCGSFLEHEAYSHWHRQMGEGRICRAPKWELNWTEIEGTSFGSGERAKIFP